MANKNGDDSKAQADAQKAHAENWKAQNEERDARWKASEAGPVSVAEHTQANPNPSDQHKDTPRPEAQKDAGMDENTLQEDVGLKDPKTGIQPQPGDKVDKANNEAAVSTGAPQSKAEKEADKADKSN